MFDQSVYCLIHCCRIAFIAQIFFLPVLSISHASNHDLDLFSGDDDNPPVVLSASKLKQSLSRSPSSITIIDKELIANSGARSIVDILLLVPGFQVGRHTNGDPTAAYHGEAYRDNNQLQLLIDGRPTYVPLFGGIPWSELPISVADIERVEVIRAPNAASFGPNSFSSVISITTIDPSTAASFSYSSEIGGNSFATTGISTGGSLWNGDYRVSVQIDKDEGYENIRDKERANVGNFSASWQLDPSNRIDVSLGGARGGHIEDNEANGIYFYPYERINNHYAQFVWEQSGSVDDNFRLQVYHNFHNVSNAANIRFDAAELFGDPSLQGVFLDTLIDKEATATRSEVELEKTFRLSKSHRFVAGVAMRQDSVRSNWLFSDSDKRTFTTSRIFTHSEVDLGKSIVANVGFLAEENTLFGGSIAPRLSLHMNPARYHYLRLGYSRGVRAPLPYEVDGQIQYFGQTTNGFSFTDVYVFTQDPVDHEISDVYDIGYQYIDQKKGLLFDGKLSYTKVRNEVGISDYVPFDPDTFDTVARYVVNQSPRYNTTFELDLEYRKRKTRLRMGYSHPFNVKTKRPMSSPKHTLSIFGSRKINLLDATLSAEYYYNSPWVWVDVSRRDRSMTSRLSRLDLRVSLPFIHNSLNGQVIFQTEQSLGRNINYIPRNTVGNSYFMKISFDLP